MLGELLTAAPAPSRRPPGHARWKAPLSYHFLAWDGDDRYVVAARGRVCRTTTWVPLEKVQSIRWVQGPVQRRLGLASVRLDVAGRRVTASIQDRAVAEADEVLARLPDLARAARTQAARAARSGSARSARPGPARPHPAARHPAARRPGTGRSEVLSQVLPHLLQIAGARLAGPFLPREDADGGRGCRKNGVKSARGDSSMYS